MNAQYRNEMEKRFAERSTAATATVTDSYAKLERDAHARAALSRGTITPEKAVVEALESHPEAYAEYRDKHNAGVVIAQLQRAGVKLQGT